MRSPAGRIAIVAGTVVVLVVLFVALRGRGEDEPAAGPTTTTAPTTTETATTTTSTERTTTSVAIVPVAPRRIRVTVLGGRVAGGVKIVPVEQGEQIVLVVRADVSDHVHLHGYDLMADVGPGAPAQLAVRATIPGRFEVELEDRKLRILELEVRP